MELEQNNSGRKLLLLIGGVVLGALLGALITAIYFQNKAKQLKAELSRMQQEAGKAGSLAVPAPPDVSDMPIPAEITSISGTVEKIDGNTLTVKTNLFGNEKTYRVKITENTKITKREILQNPPQSKEGEVINPFKDSEAAIGDIREKDNLTIEASENVKDKTEFEAKSVIINITNLPDVPEPPKIEDLPKPPEIPSSTSEVPSAPPGIPEPPK